MGDGSRIIIAQTFDTMLALTALCIGDTIATITVRNLDAEVQRRIRRQAALHDRSMEAEARSILTAAVIGGDIASAWVDATADFRGEDLAIPARATPRELRLS